MDEEQSAFGIFEPKGDSFIYRSTLTARGVLVSSEEREQMTTVYKGRRRIAIILSILNLPLTFCVARAINATPALSSWTAPVAWTMLLSVTIAAFAWANVGPRRIMRGRPYVDFGMPPFLLEERRRETLRKTSWIKLFRRWFSIYILGYIAFIHAKDEDFGRVEAAEVMVFAFLSFASEAIDKYGSYRNFSLAGRRRIDP